jgi:hypothetical protein
MGWCQLFLQGGRRDSMGILIRTGEKCRPLPPRDVQRHLSPDQASLDLPTAWLPSMQICSEVFCLDYPALYLAVTTISQKLNI